jgi:hypothetical protein
VDNSDFAPTHLTGHPTLLMISKLFPPHLSNSKDENGPSRVRVPAPGLPSTLSSVASAS